MGCSGPLHVDVAAERRGFERPLCVRRRVAARLLQTNTRTGLGWAGLPLGVHSVANRRRRGDPACRVQRSIQMGTRLWAIPLRDSMARATWHGCVLYTARNVSRCVPPGIQPAIWLVLDRVAADCAALHQIPSSCNNCTALQQRCTERTAAHLRCLAERHAHERLWVAARQRWVRVHAVHRKHRIAGDHNAAVPARELDAAEYPGEC
jgi:hypothetical protein